MQRYRVFLKAGHNFVNLTYDEMMPLCGDMTGVAKGIAGLGALFYVAAKVWQRRVPAAPSLCAGAVHPVLPHVRAGDYQHGIVACGERLQPVDGNADFRHERVPGTEGQAGI